jgi:hypothetical protein
MEINFFYPNDEILKEFKDEFNKTKNLKFKKEYNLKISHFSSNKFLLEIYQNNKLIKKYQKYNFENFKKFIEKTFKKKDSKINFSLYSDDNPKTTLKGTGFKDEKKAKETLELIKNKDIVYQKQVLNTLINRAKYHPHQTKEMKDAIKIFQEYYQKLK